MNKFKIEVDFDDSDDELPEEGMYYIKTIDERYIAYFYINPSNQIYCRLLFKYKDLEWYPTTICPFPARHMNIIHKRSVKEIKIKV